MNWAKAMKADESQREVEAYADRLLTDVQANLPVYASSAACEKTHLTERGAAGIIFGTCVREIHVARPGTNALESCI